MAASARTLAINRLIPLYNRVLVKKADPVQKTKAGIHIPEKARGKVLKGTVVSVGSGSRNEKGQHIPCCVKEGDLVLLPDYGGLKIENENNEVLYLYKEYDLLAKVHG